MPNDQSHLVWLLDSPLISSLLGALVGGFIAGYFSLVAMRRTFKQEKEKAKEQDQKVEFGLLQALHDEMDILWERYNATMGAQLEALQDNQALLFYYPVGQDYFPVYRGNTFLISRIRNNDLRRLIVCVYTKANGMVDSFRMNNELVGKHDYWNSIFQNSKQEKDRQTAIQFYQRCVDYSKKLKSSHLDLKKM
jgi:hypothetical protein